MVIQSYLCIIALSKRNCCFSHFFYWFLFFDAQRTDGIALWSVFGIGPGTKYPVNGWDGEGMPVVLILEVMGSMVLLYISPVA